MNYQQFKLAVIARCQELGLNDYELYYQESSSTSVEVFQHAINEFTSATEGGVCFRCIVGGKMGYASTQALNDSEARAVVDRAVDNALALETEDPAFLAEGGQIYEEKTASGGSLPTTEKLIETVLATQEQLYATDPAVIDGCQSQAIAEGGIIAICNSRGLDLQDETRLSGLIVVSVVRGEGEMANDYAIKLGDLDTIDTQALVQKATASALAKLGGDVAPTGQYSVVFAPEAMTSLLSTFSGIFSSENAQKGLSPLAGKEGEVIAAPWVTLVDDPAYPGSPLQRTFDAEGSPTHRKAVIENGVLNTLLYNLKTAALAGKATTGNASKAGYDAPVGVGPYTLYLAAGDLTEEELLAPIEKGVYINSLGGLHAGANPITGDFSLQSSGFLIQGGKKTDFVKSFTVAGNFQELLKNIAALANNLETPGMGRFGSPSVRVEGLSIAGK